MLFLAALAAMTAGLHYSRGSPPPSAYFSSSGLWTEHSALFNYAWLLAATGTVYLASRAATAAVTSAIPPSVKASASARRAALLVLCGPVAGFALHAAAGRPNLVRHAAVQWLMINFERSAMKDAAWCARLFALLVFWQAVLAVAALAFRTVARGIASLHTAGVDADSSSGSSSSGRGWSGRGGGRGRDDVAAAAAAAATAASASAFAAAAAASAAAEKVLHAGDAAGEGFDESAGEKDLNSGESGEEGEAEGEARSGMMAPALG